MYLISVLAIILCFVLNRLLNVSAVVRYFDAMSLLFLFVLIMPIMISTGLLKDLNRAFRMVFGKKGEASMLEMKRAKLAVDTMIKVSMGSGIFVAVMQVQAVLHYMAAPTSIGPAISIALLAVLYAVVISLLLYPIGAKVEERILEYMPSDAESGMEEQSEVSGKKQSGQAEKSRETP